VLMSTSLLPVSAEFELGKTLKSMLGVLEEHAEYPIERLLWEECTRSFSVYSAFHSLLDIRLNQTEG
jgi:hypothetical protein